MVVRPRVAAKSRRQQQEMFGISRLEEWAIIDRAVQKGEPPTDTSLDRQLLALVTWRRVRLRRFWLVMSLYSLVLLVIKILAVALNPTAENVVQLAIFTSISVSLWVAWAYCLRRMARLEKELRNRLPQPMELQWGRPASGQPQEGRSQEEPPQAEWPQRGWWQP
jgi:hypothetical protein